MIIELLEFVVTVRRTVLPIIVIVRGLGVQDRRARSSLKAGSSQVSCSLNSLKGLIYGITYCRGYNGGYYRSLDYSSGGWQNRKLLQAYASPALPFGGSALLVQFCHIPHCAEAP